MSPSKMPADFSLSVNPASFSEQNAGVGYG